MTGGTYASIIGQGVSGIGSGLSMIASMQEQAAMDEAIQYEMNRQQAYGQEGSRYFAQSLYNSLPQTAGQQIATGARDQAGLYGQLYSSKIPGEGTVTSPRQQAKLGTYVGALSQAGAQRAGYGSWLNQLGISNMYYNSLLSALAQRSKASADVLSSEIQAAQNSEQNLDTWGKVVYDLGQSISSSGGGGSGGIDWGGSSY